MRWTMRERWVAPSLVALQSSPQALHHFTRFDQGDQLDPRQRQPARQRLLKVSVPGAGGLIGPPAPRPPRSSSPVLRTPPRVVGEPRRPS